MTTTRDGMIQRTASHHRGVWPPQTAMPVRRHALGVQYVVRPLPRSPPEASLSCYADWHVYDCGMGHSASCSRFPGPAWGFMSFPCEESCAWGHGAPTNKGGLREGSLGAHPCRREEVLLR